MSTKNSIIGDVQTPTSWTSFAAEGRTELPPSDWERLGKSKRYKEIHEYLEVRKEFYRHYLPGGKAIRESEASFEQKGLWTSAASTIIDEIEGIQAQIYNVTAKG